MKEVQYCRQMRWHKRHLRTVTGKISVEEYEALKAVCRDNHTTPYSVMTSLARAYMRKPREAEHFASR